jgi:hypothetical protein
MEIKETLAGIRSFPDGQDDQEKWTHPKIGTP